VSCHCQSPFWRASVAALTSREPVNCWFYGGGPLGELKGGGADVKKRFSCGIPTSHIDPSPNLR
jgi:hypothetical protein